MVWVNTPQKFQSFNVADNEVPDANVENAEKALNVSGTEENRPEEIVEAKEETRQIPFEESDFQTRVPHTDYVSWKNIEDLVLSLNSKENLTAFVVCAGILYGNGEKIFEYHFKSAWLEHPHKLPYLGEGQNLIPTIHVKDLAKISKYLVDNKPENRYVFGIDNTKDRKQISIVKAISEGIGTGLIESTKPSGMDWEHFLSINVWVKPSSLLVPEEDTPSPIEWTCLEGIYGNILKLNNEFNLKRGLRPIKVFVSGPPASGKTHFSKKLSAEYNVPHVKVKELIVECALTHTEIGQKVKKINESGERVPDDLLSEVFRWKLHMNHCRNRGFILDGYPRNFKEAQNLFRKEKKNESQNLEEEEPKAKEWELDSEILPQSVVVFRASVQFLLERIEELRHKHQEFNFERMERRLRIYRQDNELAEKSVFDYFADFNTEIFECEATDLEIEIIENLKIYIEREGRPYNFLASVQEMVENRRKFIEERDLNKVSSAEESKKAEEQANQEVQARREKAAYERFLDIKKQLENASKDRSIPLRKYLMENIMPTLAESLIQVCKIMPEDPVDYVSELIYAHSKQKKV